MRDERGTTIGRCPARHKPKACAIFSAQHADMLKKEREAGPRSAIDASRRLPEEATGTRSRAMKRLYSRCSTRCALPGGLADEKQHGEQPLAKNAGDVDPF